MARFLLLPLLLIVSLLFSISSAEIRTSDVRSDDRPIIPFDEFGFTHSGILELNVSKIHLSNTNPDLDLAKIGFFVCTRDTWLHVLQQFEDGEITCALQSDLIKTVFTFKAIPKNNDYYGVVYTEHDADQYTFWSERRENGK